MKTPLTWSSTRGRDWSDTRNLSPRLAWPNWPQSAPIGAGQAYPTCAQIVALGLNFPYKRVVYKVGLPLGTVLSFYLI